MKDTVLVVLVGASLVVSGIALSQALRKPEAPPPPAQIGRYQFVVTPTGYGSPQSRLLAADTVTGQVYAHFVIQSPHTGVPDLSQWLPLGCPTTTGMQRVFADTQEGHRERSELTGMLEAIAREARAQERADREARVAMKAKG